MSFFKKLTAPLHRIRFSAQTLFLAVITISIWLVAVTRFPGLSIGDYLWLTSLCCLLLCNILQIRQLLRKEDLPFDHKEKNVRRLWISIRAIASALLFFGLVVDHGMSEPAVPFGESIATFQLAQRWQLWKIIDGCCLHLGVFFSVVPLWRYSSSPKNKTTKAIFAVAATLLFCVATLSLTISFGQILDLVISAVHGIEVGLTNFAYAPSVPRPTDTLSQDCRIAFRISAIALSLLLFASLFLVRFIGNKTPTSRTSLLCSAAFLTMGTFVIAQNKTAQVFRSSLSMPESLSNYSIEAVVTYVSVACLLGFLVTAMLLRHFSPTRISIDRTKLQSFQLPRVLTIILALLYVLNSVFFFLLPDVGPLTDLLTLAFSPFSSKLMKIGQGFHSYEPFLFLCIANIWILITHGRKNNQQKEQLLDGIPDSQSDLSNRRPNWRGITLAVLIVATTAWLCSSFWRWQYFKSEETVVLLLLCASAASLCQKKQPLKAAHTTDFESKKSIVAFLLATGIMVSSSISLLWFAVTAFRALNLDWLTHLMETFFLY